MGKRESGGSARGLRRGEALREALTTAYRESRGADTAIVRIFNTYGPRMRPNDGRAIPTFVQQALAGVPLTVAGDGRQTRSVCYVDDTVAGVLALAESEFTGLSTLEIATRRRSSILHCGFVK